MENKEYTVTDLMKILGVCRITVYKLLKNGEIKYYRRYDQKTKGNMYIITKDSFNNYLERKNIKLESDSEKNKINYERITPKNCIETLITNESYDEHARFISYAYRLWQLENKIENGEIIENILNKDNNNS